MDRIFIRLDYRTYTSMPNINIWRENMKFDYDKKIWQSYKHPVETYKILNKYFNDVPIIKKQLSKYSHEMNDSDVTIEKIKHIINDKYAFLYDFQKDIVTNSIDLFHKNNKGVNLWQEVGIGKTLQALCIINGIQESKNNKGDGEMILILAPKALQQQWKEEIEKWGLFENKEVQIINGTPQKRIQQYNNIKKQIFICSYETFRLDYKKGIVPRFHYIICDESTKFKNHQSQLNKALKKLSKENPTTFWVLLTGTPIPNRLIDAFNQNTIIDNITYSGHVTKFKDNHAIWDVIYLKYKEHEVIVGYRDADKFLDLIKPHTFIIKKNDVHEQLPKETYIDRNFEITSQQKKVYNQILEDIDEDDELNIFQYFSLLKMLDDSPETLMHSKSDKIKNLNIQKDAFPKLQQLEEDITEINGNHQILIFTTFKSTASCIFDKLNRDHKNDVMLVNGDTKQETKEMIIKQFKNKEFKILIATDCLSYGVSFSNVDYLINFDLPFSYGDYIQRNGRICRIDSKNNKTIINYIGGVIGQRVKQVLKEKTSVANKIEMFKFLIKRKEDGKK